MSIAQHSSATAEHPTPPEVVEPARRLLGGFDLDPATTPAFNFAIKARWFYTEADDGLRQPWSGRVFCNPPGGVLIRDGERWVRRTGKGPGESSMRVWWDYLVRQYLAGPVVSAVFVGFTLEILRTSQACVLPVQVFPRCYPKERIAFQGDDPTHANVIVYLPPKTAAPGMSLHRMTEEFGSLGFCEGGRASLVDAKRAPRAEVAAP